MMETNERIAQKRVVLDSPGERREVITETTRAGPEAFTLSPGTLGVIAILVAIVIGIAIYVVSNRNENEAANRAAASQVSKEQVPPTIIQQPAVLPAPVIIQQPAPAQPAPVIIQQPAQPSGAIIDDATMQELATKRLADEPGLASVLAVISEGRAVLSGTVNSAASKVKAEQLAKSVRGVKSVDNQLALSIP
jgi:hyperosmotically inducible periplasmic protein